MLAQTWIRASLKEKGFKLKDAAAALNITPPRVTDILKGMREVQADEILPLATLLGMSSKSLLSSLAAGEKTNTGIELEGPVLPVLGSLTGTGDLLPLPEDAPITSVPVPPDAESHEGLFCYIMGDDSLEQEIRQGSLIIAGDPRTHFFPMVPGSIFIVDMGSGVDIGPGVDIDARKLTARQYFRSSTGEDWLVPLPTNHNPHYESWRFSILPAELEQNVVTNAEIGTETSAHKIVRTADIAAVVMWVHRRYTPEK